MTAIRGDRRPGENLDAGHLGRRRRGVIVAAAALFAVLVGCSSPDARAGSPSGAAADRDDTVQYRAADALTGRPVDLTDLRGRPVLLSSWATWCAPCRTELPALERLHRDRGDDGLLVVTVNIDSADADEAAVRAMADELGLTMTQWRDEQDTFTTTFKGIAIPMSVLLDPDGRVVETWHGPLDPDDEDVRRQIDDVLGDSATD